MASWKTDQELVDEALELANKFYALQGYIARPGFKFYDSPHPAEQLMWRMACEAFEFIRGSDVIDALMNLEEDQ